MSGRHRAQRRGGVSHVFAIAFLKLSIINPFGTNANSCSLSQIRFGRHVYARNDLSPGRRLSFGLYISIFRGESEVEITEVHSAFQLNVPFIGKLSSKALNVHIICSSDTHGKSALVWSMSSNVTYHSNRDHVVDIIDCMILPQARLPTLILLDAPRPLVQALSSRLGCNIENAGGKIIDPLNIC